VVCVFLSPLPLPARSGVESGSVAQLNVRRQLAVDYNNKGGGLVKKNEQPELSAKWWAGSQPKGLKSADKLESALKSYEGARKKLESSSEEDVGKAARDALGAVESAVDAVIAEASKDKKNPEMGFTVDALKKFDKFYGAEHAWIEEHTEEDDEGMFSDPEAFHVYLTKGLKRLRSSGQMNFGMALGKKAEDHRLALNKSKSGKALGSMLTKETGLHVFTFGIAMTPKAAGLAEEEGDAPGQGEEGEKEKPRALVLSLEGRQIPGLGMKGARMLKKFKPQPFNKIILMLEGKVVPDLADPDDTDTDTAPGYDAAALKRELAGLIGRVQALTDLALKGDLARLASQANAGLNGNNLGGAVAAIEKLREALDAASNRQGQANGGQATTGAETYTKSRDIWLATRKKIEGEIEKLRSEIVATYQQDGIAGELETRYAAKVAPVLTTLDESLATKLDEVSKETNSARRVALVNQARTILEDYQSFVTGDPIIPQLDKNPFVELSIQQTVTATLSALGRALH
jgi:hypothetical protein